MDPFQRREVFNHAAELVERGWCRNRMSETNFGGGVSYCALGALKASLEKQGMFLSHETSQLERNSIVAFNDLKAKQAEEVAERLRGMGRGEFNWR